MSQERSDSLAHFLDVCNAVFLGRPDEPHYVAHGASLDGEDLTPRGGVLYLPPGWTIERFLRERTEGKWKLRRRAS